MPGRVRHGMHKTPENTAWRHMKDRCFNPKSQRYDRYGGRGITVCDRWLVFENFYADMGPRPSPGHSIERIDNDGNYEPDNCRWATRAEQAVNKSDNVLIEYRGERLTVAQWSRRIGIAQKTLSERLRTGWPISHALTTPVEGRVWSKSPAGQNGTVPAPNYGPHGNRKRWRKEREEVFLAIQRERGGAK